MGSVHVIKANLTLARLGFRGLSVLRSNGKTFPRELCTGGDGIEKDGIDNALQQLESTVDLEKLTDVERRIHQVHLQAAKVC